MKIKQISIITLICFIIIDFCRFYLFNNWTFSNPEYVRIVNSILRLIFWFSIGGIIIGSTKVFHWGTGIIFSFIAFISILLVYNPIDTTEEPIDKKLIASQNDQKTIIRTTRNAKSHNMIIDTVTVKDFGIIRKIVE